MAYDLYTELVANNVPEDVAGNFCKVAAPFGIGPGDLQKDDGHFRYISHDYRADLRISTNEDKEYIIWGYYYDQNGRTKVEFVMNPNNRFVITLYDSKDRGLFDTNDAVKVITNEHPCFRLQESPEFVGYPHWYYYSLDTVKVFDTISKTSEEHIPSNFSKKGLLPERYGAIIEDTYDQYEQIGKILGNNGIELEQNAYRK